MEQSVNGSSSVAFSFVFCSENASDHAVGNNKDLVKNVLALIAESLGEFAFQPD
jgi:hypothetical protein